MNDLEEKGFKALNVNDNCSGKLKLDTEGVIIGHQMYNE